MAAKVIGSVTGFEGKSYEVKWDQASRDVYVFDPPHARSSWFTKWAHIGRAFSADEALTTAERWVRFWEGVRASKS